MLAFFHDCYREFAAILVHEDVPQDMKLWFVWRHPEDQKQATVHPEIVSILIDSMKEQLGLLEKAGGLIATKIRKHETLSEEASSEILTLFKSISATVDEALTLRYLE